MSENILPPPPMENLNSIGGSVVVLLDGQASSVYAAVWAMRNMKGRVVAAFTVHGQADAWAGYEEARMTCEALKLPFVCAHLVPFEIDRDGKMVCRNEGLVLGMRDAGAAAVVLGLRRVYFGPEEGSAWWAAEMSKALKIPIFAPGAILPWFVRYLAIRDALGAFLASRVLPD